MDWRELLHNRWVWAGVAGAAGLGGIVWWRRRGTTPAGGGAAETPAYASGAVGSFDSTGTDVAGWLGRYSGSLDNQFREFQRSVEQQLAALQVGDAPPAPSTNYSDPAPRRFEYQPIVISGTDATIVSDPLPRRF